MNKLENYLKQSFYHPDRWEPKDENHLLKTGLYQLKGLQTSLKQGFAGSQAFIMVFNTSAHNDDWITQIAISYYIQYSIAIRTRPGDTKIWTPWRYFTAT